MTDTPIRIRIESPNKQTRFQLEAIAGATEGFQILPSDDKTPPDLVILEIGDNPDAVFQEIEDLTAGGTDVFVTAKDAAPELLLKAMRSGAREYFTQPVEEEEVRQALRKLRDKTRRPAAKPVVHRGRVLHLMGCKGGVGTTTIAVNLATILASKHKDKTVCLVDLNPNFGEIPLFLDLKPAYTWGEVLKNMDRLDATYLMNVLTRHPSGVHLLAAPHSMNGHMTRSADQFAKMLAFIQKVFDYIVIDTGQAVNDTSLKVFNMADDALLISVLTFPALANTSRLLQSLSSVGYKGNERARIVINRYLKKSDISLADAEKSLSSKIYWTIPNDYRSTISAINQGKPLPDLAPRAPITRNLADLATRLYEMEAPTLAKRWKLFGW